MECDCVFSNDNTRNVIVYSFSSGSEGSLHIQDETTPSPTPDEDDDIEHMTLQRVKDEVLDWKEYKDNDYGT